MRDWRTEQRKCPVCGVMFTPNRPQQKYCSQGFYSCATDAARARGRERYEELITSPAWQEQHRREQASKRRDAAHHAVYNLIDDDLDDIQRALLQARLEMLRVREIVIDGATFEERADQRSEAIRKAIDGMVRSAHE